MSKNSNHSLSDEEKESAEAVFEQEKNNKNNWMLWVGLLLLFLVAFLTDNYFSTTKKIQTTNHDFFANCLTKNGFVLYKTYVCPVCKEEEKIFGTSYPLLKTVECSPSGPKSQYAYCKSLNITAVPTWQYPDGTLNVGFLSLEELSTISGCNL